MNFDELYNVPQWSKNFWNPCISPIASEILPPILFDNFYSGIKNYNFKWHDSDTHELFLKQRELLNPKYHNKEINYTFNAHGYRSESFDTDTDLKIIVLGCSVAFGTGIDDKDIWSAQLLKLISDKFNKKVKVYNLSIPGASTDLNAITLFQLIGIIKPNIVLWLPPSSSRRAVNCYYLQEMFKEDIRIEPSRYQHVYNKVLPSNLKHYPGMENIISDSENYNNLVKNHALINEICLNNNAIFKSLHNQLILSDAYEYFKYYFSDCAESPRSLIQEHTGIAIDLFYKLDNVINYEDLVTYSEEFFSTQSKEDIHMDIKYPVSRDNIHQSELFHKFLAYIASNLITEKDFHI